jgi:hypothetical protein
VWIGGAITALVVVGVVAFVAVTRNPDIPDFYTPPDEVTASGKPPNGWNRSG